MNQSRWKVPLECRRCGNTGEAVLSHVTEGDGSAIEYMPGGFEALPPAPGSKVVNIICSDCRRSALPHTWHVRDIWQAVSTMLPRLR